MPNKDKKVRNLCSLGGGGAANSLYNTNKFRNLWPLTMLRMRAVVMDVPNVYSANHNDSCTYFGY